MFQNYHPTVNIIVYDSLFQRYDSIDNYLYTYHLTPWHLNPAAAIDSAHNWHDKLG